MPKLDGSIFFIVNTLHSHAKLAQWDTKPRDMGTSEEKMCPEQLWRLEPEPKHPGYYYICNVAHDGYRIRKWGKSDEDVGIESGHYNDDQLWKFSEAEDEGEGYYRIVNFQYKRAKLAKYGKGDSEFGTEEGNQFSFVFWKLVPLFEASLVKAYVWHIDNRQGTHDVQVQRSVTKGVKLTQKSPIIKSGFSTSLKYSASIAIEKLLSFGGEVNMATHEDIEASLGPDVEKDSHETMTVTYTAPTGVNYRVTQWQLKFQTMMPEDKTQCQVFSKIDVEETQEEFTD